VFQQRLRDSLRTGVCAACAVAFAASGCAPGPVQCRSVYATGFPDVTVTNQLDAVLTVSGVTSSPQDVPPRHTAHMMGSDPGPATHDIQILRVDGSLVWGRQIDHSDGLIAITVSKSSVTFRNRVAPPGAQECRLGGGPWPRSSSGP